MGGECLVRAVVNATFDPTEGTITIPVPLEVVEGKPGSKIGPGATLFGGTIYAVPAAVVAPTAAPHDTLTIDKVYGVPGAKKKKKKR